MPLLSALKPGKMVLSSEWAISNTKKIAFTGQNTIYILVNLVLTMNMIRYAKMCLDVELHHMLVYEDDMWRKKYIHENNPSFETTYFLVVLHNWNLQNKNLYLLMFTVFQWQYIILIVFLFYIYITGKS